jgi:hypothetical protein
MAEVEKIVIDEIGRVIYNVSCLLQRACGDCTKQTGRCEISEPIIFNSQDSDKKYEEISASNSYGLLL